jgi:hypothetical protein
MTKKFVIGNFEWVGAKDDDVEFQPNPTVGLKVSWIPSIVDNTLQLQNRVKGLTESASHNDNVVKFGCDPFSYKSTHGKGSKGSIRKNSNFARWWSTL